MNKKVLKTLEYNKITEKLAAHAYSAEAKRRCRDLIPMTDISAIEEAQLFTGDALSRIYKNGSVSFSGVTDVAPSIARLRLGASLSAGELLKICGLLETAKRLKKYATNEKTGEAYAVDSLNAMFTALDPINSLQEEIRRCIISEDEIADDASTALRSIRKKIAGMNGRVHDELNKIINKESVRECLRDSIITMRDGRFCIPVRSEFKNRVPGMVHDQSSTGSTVFIEPLSVVNLNNELKTLLIEEKEEIEHILEELSLKVGEYSVTLESDFRVLSELDFIFAKGELAKDFNGVKPIFNKDRIIKIRKGRHPLLDAKKVVPIDIELGENFDLLIITGPNTGGKTVSLKTMGLLTLMGQAGLHIPAGDRSELSVFHEVYADIGDEQSIEQNLSTFSSHMTNIITMLKQVDKNSLVLFDELCAGTDPTEGAALAISILDELHTRGIRTMATTHYSEIKVYALKTPFVENGCCEFDVETLSPTYRLLIGIPGKSNAFAISKKLGLPDSIIEGAKGRITESRQNFEELIADLEISKVTMEREKAEIEADRKKHADLKEKISDKERRLAESRDKILRQANEEAAEILQKAKDYADEVIRDFRKYGENGASMKDMELERAILREELKDKRGKAGSAPKASSVEKKHTPPKKLKIGDDVRVISMNTSGTVHTLPDAKGFLMVQMGILKSRVNISDLEIIEENADAKAAKKKYEKKGQGVRSAGVSMSKAMNVSAEIMLIGKKVDEALPELDKYLDDAYLAHVPSVRVVHGKGTGALRNAVHGMLKKLPYVDSYKLGEFGEGDAGVTIVTFK